MGFLGFGRFSASFQQLQCSPVLGDKIVPSFVYFSEKIWENGNWHFNWNSDNGKNERGGGWIGGRIRFFLPGGKSSYWTKKNMFFASKCKLEFPLNRKNKIIWLFLKGKHHWCFFPLEGFKHLSLTVSCVILSWHSFFLNVLFRSKLLNTEIQF